MAEINIDNKIKIIALYLPQFHQIPENDKWWGNGFTEWVNTRKALPLFENHYQPRLPLNDNHYNLIDDNVKIWQTNLAKKYGIYGFCYYHYWFENGKKLLEKPMEQMLANHEIDLPFCICWANENWTKRWDGGNNEIIMKQDYGNEADWEKHFLYLLPFFKDERYITVDGKPLFVIYRPRLIDEIDKMLNYFRKRAIEEGFTDLCFTHQYPQYKQADYKRELFDFSIKFEPLASQMKHNFMRNNLSKIRLRVEKFVGRKIEPKLKIFNYDETWQKILNNIPTNNRVIPGAFVDWDNTSRNKKGFVYTGATPEKFEEYMRNLVTGIKGRPGQKMIFINAWNEWAEGAYLEPDERYGHGYLEAVRDALLKN